ncbi:hypothetical protein LOAG_14554, partial [Loa loa]
MDFFLGILILMAKITLYQAQQYPLNNHQSNFDAFTNDEHSGVSIANEYPQ